MSVTLAALAAVLAFAFMIYALWQRQVPRDGWLGLLPLVLILLVALAALLIENVDEGSFSLAEYVLLAVALLMLLDGGVVSLLEPFRVRFRTSRGLWSLMTGGLLLIMTLLAPFLAARDALSGQLADRPTATPGPTRTMNQVARDVYDRVLEVIADETGYKPATISRRLDTGDATVAGMVREQNGDVEAVIQDIRAIMTDAIQNLAADDRMDSDQAALTISALETVVRAGVEFDLEGLMARFEE